MGATGTTSGRGRAKWVLAAISLALAALAVEFLALRLVVTRCAIVAGTKAWICMLVDLCILCRILFGIWRVEKGRGWLFYAILSWAIIPIIGGAVDVVLTAFHECPKC